MLMALIDQVQRDMTAAMKASAAERLNALRMIKAALMKYKVDTMKPLDEPAELQILTTLIKQRRESADIFSKNNRPELADKEENELALIESYMPAAPTAEEVECGNLVRDGGNGSHFAEANGRGHEGRAGETRRKARRRESAQRTSSREVIVSEA